MRVRTLRGLMGCLAGALVLVSLVTSTGCQKRSPFFSRSSLPIVPTWRHVPGHPGKVVRFTNTSSRHLVATLVFENRALGQRMTGTLRLAPHGWVDVGWREGWQFVSGEQVIISHPDYPTATYNIP